MTATNPIASIEMQDGATITVELFPEKAPNTVANFVSLANKGYYDGLIFHRIIDGFMIQGGCPDGSGMGGPGYSIPGEFAVNGFTQNDILHDAGVISMARSAHFDSAGSQFFLMVGRSPHLDGQYAAFGKVCDDESLALCLQYGKTPTAGSAFGDRPTDPPIMKKVRVDTKGVEYQEPQKT